MSSARSGNLLRLIAIVGLCTHALAAQSLHNRKLHVTTDSNVVSLRYAPEMEWSGGDGAFVSDRALLAPVRLSGRVLPAAKTPDRGTVLTSFRARD